MIRSFQTKGYQVVSMDALFGLCRKRSAGVSVRKPLFEGVFFEDQIALLLTLNLLISQMKRL